MGNTLFRHAIVRPENEFYRNEPVYSPAAGAQAPTRPVFLAVRDESIWKLARYGRWFEVAEQLAPGTRFSDSTEFDTSYTLLHYAAEKGNAAAVKMLLGKTRSGILCQNVNAKELRGKTALMLAAERRRKLVVNNIIESDLGRKSSILQGSTTFANSQNGIVSDCGPVDVNARDKERRTALMIAAELCDVDIVKALTEHEADANAFDDNGCNALHLVPSRKRVNNTFIHCMPDDYSCTSTMQTVEALIERGGIGIGTPANSSETALHIAAKGNSVEEVKLLLLNGTSINARNKRGETALHVAMIEDCPRVAEVLLDADPSIKDLSLKTALDYIACEHCRQSLVQWVPACSTDMTLEASHGPNKAKYSSFRKSLLRGDLNKESTANVLN